MEGRRLSVCHVVQGPPTPCRCGGSRDPTLAAAFAVKESLLVLHPGLLDRRWLCRTWQASLRVSLSHQTLIRLHSMAQARPRPCLAHAGRVQAPPNVRVGQAPLSPLWWCWTTGRKAHAGRSKSFQVKRNRPAFFLHARCQLRAGCPACTRRTQRETLRPGPTSLKAFDVSGRCR